MYSAAQKKDTSTGTDYNRYEVLHLDKITEFSDLKDAKMEDAASGYYRQIWQPMKARQKLY